MVMSVKVRPVADVMDMSVFRKWAYTVPPQVPQQGAAMGPVSRGLLLTCHCGVKKNQCKEIEQQGSRNMKDLDGGRVFT